MARTEQLLLKHTLGQDDWNNIWNDLFANRVALRDSSRRKRQLETAADSIVPLSTVTVFDTTIFQTTFVTLHASSLTSSLPTTSKVRSSISSSASSSTSTSRSKPSSGSTRTVLPSVIVDGSQHNSPSSTTSQKIPNVMTTESAVPGSTANSFIARETEHKINKTAIVGGLSGTIAGLLFIGVIVCLVLRRRRKKSAETAVSDWARRDDALFSYGSEKGPVTAVAHHRPATAVIRDSPAPAFQGPPSAAPAVDEDHRIIRMSTCHWPRPFAPGAGEGYRESVPTGQLRCTNPDTSRPGTPQSISNAPKYILRRQRALFGGSSMSQSQQRHPLAQDMPTIKVVDPALSRECVSRYSNTPSFKSYPSISTVQVVQHRTPDDPFLTPTAKEPVEYGHPKRPNVARTISASIGSLLHPLRNRSASNLDPGVRVSSQYSVDTESSARYSRRSDPFDLDRSSRGWTVGSAGRRSQILYEGT